MIKFWHTLGALLLSTLVAAAADVLIVADEIPAMEVLAKHWQQEAGVNVHIVTQSNLPPALTNFSTVAAYIHGTLKAPAENALIDFTTQGGKLIVLHHSISSGKRTNQDWFRFLGVSLPEGNVDQGGYKWIEPVTLEFVNLAPEHPITTGGVTYPTRIEYRNAPAGGGTQLLPGFVLKETEVYLNHVLTEPRTILLGFKYTDAKSGKIYMQDRAGWSRKAGRGWIFYFMAGHSARDFTDPTYARILVNALTFKP
jgi:hypothetical protein